MPRRSCFQLLCLLLERSQVSLTRASFCSKTSNTLTILIFQVIRKLALEPFGIVSESWCLAYLFVLSYFITEKQIENALELNCLTDHGQKQIHFLLSAKTKDEKQIWLEHLCKNVPSIGTHRTDRSLYSHYAPTTNCVRFIQVQKVIGMDMMKSKKVPTWRKCVKYQSNSGPLTLCVAGVDKLKSSNVQGFMNKRGEINKSWKRRYFKLRGDNLLYFENAHVHIHAPSPHTSGGGQHTCLTHATAFLYQQASKRRGSIRLANFSIHPALDNSPSLQRVLPFSLQLRSAKGKHLSVELPPLGQLVCIHRQWQFYQLHCKHPPNACFVVNWQTTHTHIHTQESVITTSNQNPCKSFTCGWQRWSSTWSPWTTNWWSSWQTMKRNSSTITITNNNKEPDYKGIIARTATAAIDSSSPLNQKSKRS